MRHTRRHAYYWSRYRLPSQMPRNDGPAPIAAPQNMNSTKTNEFLDPIDDKFPTTIRGNLVRPDVPEDQFVDSWYICQSMAHHLGDFRPWSSSAPANSFRFRPFQEFSEKGRHVVAQLRSFEKDTVAGRVGKGKNAFPFRDSFLTKMNPENAVTPPPSMQTTLDRAVEQQFRHMPHISPLQAQRDVGRNEVPLSCAGKTVADTSRFPFNWKTEDWYEYEVSKARMARFHYENNHATGLDGSEVTYKIVLEGFWDHHVAKLADDVSMFVKEVGRQIVEERLAAVRKQLAELEQGETGSLDPELVAAFNANASGPFGKSDNYSTSEVAIALRNELSVLEQQCVSLINRCNVPVPGATNLYDPNLSWPYVEKLEPWVRLAEYWTSASDTSFTELEMSTIHYEFRKYFRVVVVKMPFQSTEFEKRMYDIRHWLHRQTSAEFQTIYKRNFVHDAAMFPTEHDPSVPSSDEHHRIFSFALDWHQAPAGFADSELVQKGDTWELISERLGTTVQELKACNADHTLEAGSLVKVPSTATKRKTAHGAMAQMLPLLNEEGKRLFSTWSEAAAAVGCTVEELVLANGAAAAKYDGEKGAFSEDTVQLNIPIEALRPAPQFALTEEVMASDTFESIARRVGCTVEQLKAANPGVDVHSVGVVNVPAAARHPRRLTEPLLRHETATASLIPRTIGERESTANIPTRPKNAEKFPHEYNTTSSRYPVTPAKTELTDTWLSYTAKYLDRDLSSDTRMVYNVNHLWPMQQIPGKVDQTPFEEDQTWMSHHTPVQQLEAHHPEKDIQDLPFVNQEQFPRSLEWRAP